MTLDPSPHRLESRDKATYRVPELCHAMIVRSPVAAGRVRMSGSAGQQFVPLRSDAILHPGQPIAYARPADHARQAARRVARDVRHHAGVERSATPDPACDRSGVALRSTPA